METEIKEVLDRIDNIKTAFLFDFLFEMLSNTISKNYTIKQLQKKLTGDNFINIFTLSKNKYGVCDYGFFVDEDIEKYKIDVKDLVNELEDFIGNSKLIKFILENHNLDYYIYTMCHNFVY